MFVRLSPTRSCWHVRVAARGDARPQRCSDTWTMGVPYVSSPVEMSSVKFTLAVGAYSWRRAHKRVTLDMNMTAFINVVVLLVICYIRT